MEGLPRQGSHLLCRGQLIEPTSQSYCCTICFVVLLLAVAHPGEYPNRFINHSAQQMCKLTHGAPRTEHCAIIRTGALSRRVLLSSRVADTLLSCPPLALSIVFGGVRPGTVDTDIRSMIMSAMNGDQRYISKTANVVRVLHCPFKYLLKTV